MARSTLLSLALLPGLACVSDYNPSTGDSSGAASSASAGEGGGADSGTGWSPADSGGAASSGGGADATTGGADNGSAGDSTGQGNGKHHPDGYADASVHGLAMKIHEEDCRVCHGEDLLGGSAMIDCDTCHDDGWRTDCVFCHGGEVDQTGAPPRDIDGTTDVAQLSFIAHSKHVAENDHPAYACTECHVQPDDVLSLNHVFDATDAEGEVDFSAGLSNNGAWNGTDSCDSLYCHGNGRSDNGSYKHDDPTPSCGGCHPYPGTGNGAYNTMSGRHSKHMNEGVDCRECHSLTDNDGDIAMAILHVDGKPDVSITQANFSYNAGNQSCTGSCHGEGHNNEDW